MSDIKNPYLNIKHTSVLVERILETDEHARNSDNYLYYMVCKTRLEAKGLSADAECLWIG